MTTKLPETRQQVTFQRSQRLCARPSSLCSRRQRQEQKAVPVAIGVLGMLIAISAGVSALLKFHEQWLKYRTTAESSKKEKYFFEAPYNAANAFPLLVQRVEALVSQENMNWAQYMTTADKRHDAATGRASSLFDPAPIV